MLRKSLLVLALIVGAGIGVGVAQPDPTGFGGPPHEPMRQPEVLVGRPSGFWTSTRPAQGSRYRWRIMAVGIGVLGLTGALLFRTLRRADAASLRNAR